MMMINPSPIVYDVKSKSSSSVHSNKNHSGNGNGNDGEKVEVYEVFDAIRHIRDPEHPFSLEQLNVVQEDHVFVDNENRVIGIQFTPTVKHCTLSTLIGLAIRVKVKQTLLHPFKIDIWLTAGSHDSEESINKQINDKERVTAALENPNMQAMITDCIRDRE